ncbi:hypothetical protein Nepgr_018533, partial [Nepenthes gracilis]
VTCVDLNCAGIGPSLPDSFHSFHDYSQPLLHFFYQFSSSQDSNSDPYSTHYDGKVILDGHSAGGLSVTEATYWFPDKIHAAVYVAATMLQHGFSTPQDVIDEEN